MHNTSNKPGMNNPFKLIKGGKTIVEFNSDYSGELVIPDGVKEIGTIDSKLFKGRSRLTSLIMPSSVKSIYPWAFAQCTELKSVVLSNGITKIESGVFHGCPLSSMTIPDSVVEIGVEAFAFCKQLTSVTIPDSVVEIKDSAFKGCSSLKSRVISFVFGLT